MLNGLNDIPEFVVSNAGTTDAHTVVLLLELPDSRERFELGLITAGGSAVARVHSVTKEAWSRDIRLHRDIAFAIQWTSENGHPDSLRTSNMQLG